MSNVYFDKIYNQILRKLNNTKWMEKWSINEDFIDMHIKSKSFVDGLKALLDNKNFSAKSTLNICKSMLDELALDKPPTDWLLYIYKYVLYKNFPENNEFKLSKTLDSSCQLFLTIFRIICEAQKISDDESWQSLYPMNFFSINEASELDSTEEYRKFIKAFNENYTYEMMKIYGEITMFTTLDHICGVHHLSLYIAHQLRNLNLPIDLFRLSGAAAGHDIGKYGCTGEELKRVPHLHYYYTDMWFKRHGINHMRNIAINHSTWDLELENLSLESLILIYCDFRVKNEFINTFPKMKIFSLRSAFYVILNKLENVNEEKVKRYKRVYSKLEDFESYLIYLGVNIDLMPSLDSQNKQKQNYALLHGNDIVQNLKYISINHNINLMYQLRDDNSLEAIIEKARSEHDWKSLRQYIHIFKEYSTYFTQNQKLQTMKFLFENLVHSEDDIRRQCAELIGSLIAMFDEDYRKEIPQDVELQSSCTNSFDLLKEYLQLILYHSYKTMPVYKFNIGYSLSILLDSLFNCCKKSYIPYYREIVLSFYNDKASKNTVFELFLLEAAKHIPLEPYGSELQILFSYLLQKLSKRINMVRLQALETTLELINKLPENDSFIEKLRIYFENINVKVILPSEKFILFKITTSLKLYKASNAFKDYCKLSTKSINDIFLSNLKSSTDWIKKKNQIELLLDYALKNIHSLGLHTVIHFCNLLKVSAIESIRNYAGIAILKIIPYLSPSERNEIAIELIRALEIEGNKFTEYIPQYTGQAILWLEPKELDEIIEDFIIKVKTSNINLKSLILKTIGIAISHYELYKQRFEENDILHSKRLTKMLGILLNGLGSYDSHANQVAFDVIGKDIFGNRDIDLNKKELIFKLIAKKMLTLITNNDNIDLLFLTRSASLNHIYRFISDYNFFYGDLHIPVPSKIAFFPGTFDPFSLSHKEIAKYVRNLGFEVYLAVDEFSWSKKTLPSLLRKNLVNMSISDDLDVYIYPDIFPTNIANPKDLSILKQNFPKSQIYIAIGSDVLLNSSSYKMPKTTNSIHTFSHIIFERGKNKKFEFDNAIRNISADILILNLPSKYSEISSTQIRHYIDKKRDISSMLDPMAEQYIYENGFYQREAQDKALIKSLFLDTEFIEHLNKEAIDRIVNCIPTEKQKFKNKLVNMSKKTSLRILLLKNTNKDEILGFSIFHPVPPDTLYDEFKNPHVSNYIRENSVGRIILIDWIFIKNADKSSEYEQILLTETLSKCISKDYQYAIYKNIFTNNIFSENIYNMLKLYGFIKVPLCDESSPVYAVNMCTPCILNLDIQNMIKEPFRSSTLVKHILSHSRKSLQEALTKLYPGQLFIPFDVDFVYQALIRKICNENNVPNEFLMQKTLGPFMCVPYGDILERYIIPNTVTKALHTEKLFYPDVKEFIIGEFPHYLNLETQAKMIKSFNRPVILVDNLLHKGYRMKALDPIFKEENINIQKIIVSVLSGKGKDLMDMQNRLVDSVYFIPRLKLWFNENSLYPFIGGDTLWRGNYTQRNLLPSINLVLPYTYPTFIKNTSKSAVYNLSKTCIQNSIDILQVLEHEYQITYERKLTLSSLGQVFTIPRCPDHGKNIEYDVNLSASSYLKNDLELLLRMNTAFE